MSQLDSDFDDVGGERRLVLGVLQELGHRKHDRDLVRRTGTTTPDRLVSVVSRLALCDYLHGYSLHGLKVLVNTYRPEFLVKFLVR